MLNADLKQQLQQLLGLMEDDVGFIASLGSDDKLNELKELLDEIAEMSAHIIITERSLRRAPSFSVNHPGEGAGITFTGIPLNHEFNSLVLAILQMNGRASKEKQSITDQTKGLEDPFHFEIFVSLTCQKCPDVVQALNLVSIINPNITHTTIDGAVFREKSENIMTAPAVFLDGQEFGNGRITVQDILTKLGSTQDASEFNDKDPYDVLVVGDEPASGSTVIYIARKGLHTGIVADQIGGQVNNTADIGNFITVKETAGSEFSSNLAEHIAQYDIDTMTDIRATNIERTDSTIRVALKNDAVLEGKTVIISTGASWHKLNVPGEDRLVNRGMAFCPHCDGPLFENKDVAVIGDGSSGVETAVDLAGIVKHVTLSEYASGLKADSVLRERLRSLPNVDIKTSAKTIEVIGGDYITDIGYEDMTTGESQVVNLDEIFVRIGLAPNASWLRNAVELNERGEVMINRDNVTNVPGIFAAGGVTDQKNKQIIISMSAGANAALNAFGYIIRN